MTSPLNLNCLKFNNQSSLFLSLFLTYHLLISTIKPTSYLYLSLISSSSSSQKKKKEKHIIFPPNKLLMFILLVTSPSNLNCLKFNNQSSPSLSLIISLFYGLCQIFLYDVVIQWFFFFFFPLFNFQSFSLYSCLQFFYT